MNRLAFAVTMMVAGLALTAGSVVWLHASDRGVASAPHGSAVAVRPGASSSPVWAVAPRPAPSVLRPATKLLGVSTPGSVDAWTRVTGSRPDVVEVFVGWGQSLPSLPANALPLLSWGSDSTTLASIAQGGSNAYIMRFAEQVHDAGRPIAIDFDHEFNGSWYPWGVGGTQHATSAQFVAAWQHIHDMFMANGAKNALWVWSPNVVNPVPGVALGSYWPGDEYVDWAGMVGYWTPSPVGQHTWASLYGPTEQQIRALTGDPILITETGAQQGSGKPAWVSAMLKGLRSDPSVVGLVYFDYGFAQGKRADWTLQDDSAALAAWRAGVAELRRT